MRHCKSNVHVSYPLKKPNECFGIFLLLLRNHVFLFVRDLFLLHRNKQVMPKSIYVNEKNVSSFQRTYECHTVSVNFQTQLNRNNM